ncbi:MAG: hypothetical protein E7505_11265 [Ruminococcus sp.]|nr:hypothetical protein [Ruminococcus sp.]
MDKGKMIFVTGSAMSGKSRFALSQFAENDRVQYLCTNTDIDDRILNRIVFNERSKDFRWDIIRNFSVDKTPVNYDEYKCFSSYTSSRFITTFGIYIISLLIISIMAAILFCVVFTCISSLQSLYKQKKPLDILK